MARLPVVAAAHWFVMVSFGLLFFSLVTAYGQVFDPHFALPLIGHFFLYEWAVEAIAWLSLAGILVLIAIRQKNHPRFAKADGRRSRFFGSTWWQAYYVEATILGVVVCVLSLRFLEYWLGQTEGADWATRLHFPTTSWLGTGDALTQGGIENAIIVVATVKILISMAWFITVALQPTMGVAWHRFLAFFNIWFKRNADGRTSLGALQPIAVKGEPVDFENIDELDEDAALGVGKVEDFTWKGLLDFTTCTECGRCQSQCPAWNTDKPLSPKLLMMAPARPRARQGAVPAGAGQADVPGRQERPAARGRHAGPVGVRRQGAGRARAPADRRHRLRLRRAARTCCAPTTRTVAASAELGVIDPDVLWSCTTCGACVEQCPVDIEHVDHIVDMRRYQVLIESAFPSELGGLFKNLENNQNPWGMNPRARLDWAKDLPFEVKQVGQDVESLADVEYLFWVGCAGAFEDRAKKTTRAVAELLHTAGVDFAVLGDGESCTGDPARRAGNEFLFQMLAQPNVEVLNELGAQKIVVTCAHCFNTLSNEYPQLGGNYEVVHHTQLLNRLVRDKRLVPVAPPAGAAGRQGRRDRRGHADHLPRPLLPRPAQQRLRAAARADRRAARRRVPRDGAQQGALVLLRRRRCTDVDGGDARHPDQHQPDRRGRRHRGRQDRHRLPVLPGHDERRARRPAGRRLGPRGGRGGGRRADAARRRPPRSQLSQAPSRISSRPASSFSSRHAWMRCGTSRK